MPELVVGSSIEGEVSSAIVKFMLGGCEALALALPPIGRLALPSTLVKMLPDVACQLIETERSVPRLPPEVSVMVTVRLVMVRPWSPVTC